VPHSIQSGRRDHNPAAHPIELTFIRTSFIQTRQGLKALRRSPETGAHRTARCAGLCALANNALNACCAVFTLQIAEDLIKREQPAAICARSSVNNETRYVGPSSPCIAC